MKHLDCLPQMLMFGARRWARLLGAALLGLGLAALLAACAGPISTKVTSFNQWPDGLRGSFSFVTPADKLGELEHASYENQVQIELEKLGFSRAVPGQYARLLVELETSQQTRVSQYREPIFQDNYVFLPPRRNAAGQVFPGAWVPDRFGPRYVGERLVAVAVHVSSLRLRMLDTQGAVVGRPSTVFDSRAVYEGDIGDLPVLLPLLAHAALDGFPGQNGLVHLVKFDRKTGAVIKN
jgi:hypothetical protein